MHHASRGNLTSLVVVLFATAMAPWVWAGPLTVTYRSAATVYIDGGRQAGLAVGDHLAVESRKKTIGELEVVYVAERSASCKVIHESRPVRAGDTVKLLQKAEPAGTPSPSPVPTPAAPPAAVPSAALPPPQPAPAAARKPWARVGGMLSLGYSRTWDRSESRIDVEQRTARANLRVWDIAGKPLSFTLRASSRQDLRSGTLGPFLSSDQRNDRLYEASLRYQPTDGLIAFELGRIGVSRFVGIGYLDGLLVSVRLRDSVRLGGFLGRPSDIGRIGFAGSGRKYGGFVRYDPGGLSLWSSADAELAFVRELAMGDVSREYVSLESRLGRGMRLSLFQRAEMDLNSGWREALSGKRYQLSLLSLAATYRLTQTASTSVSYDSRRNYRTQLNRSIQEEYFDMLLHQGLRGSLTVHRAGGLGYTMSFGALFTENSPTNTYSLGAGVRHGHLPWHDLSASLDVAGYTNPATKGGMVSATLARRFSGGHLLDLTYGASVYRLRIEGLTRSTHWLRLSGWAQLPRRLYLAPDLELGFGADAQGPRGAVEMGWQF